MGVGLGVPGVAARAFPQVGPLLDGIDEGVAFPDGLGIAVDEIAGVDPKPQQKGVKIHMGLLSLDIHRIHYEGGLLKPPNLLT